MNERVLTSNLRLSLVRVEPQPDLIDSSARWRWPLKPPHDNDGKCPAVLTASREWWEYAPVAAKPHPDAVGIFLTWPYDAWYWDTPSAPETSPDEAREALKRIRDRTRMSSLDFESAASAVTFAYHEALKVVGGEPSAQETGPDEAMEHLDALGKAFDCDHPRSELLARKDPVFEMRKCLDCTKIFRVRLPEKASVDWCDTCGGVKADDPDKLLLARCKCPSNGKGDGT